MTLAGIPAAMLDNRANKTIKETSHFITERNPGRSCKYCVKDIFISTSEEGHLLTPGNPQQSWHLHQSLYFQV